MFKYTRASFRLIVNEFKRFLTIFKYGSLIFTISYFTYALISQTGNFIVNIILASLFVVYTIFELLTRNKNMKGTRKKVRRSYRWINLIFKTFTLGSMIYGIYITASNVKPISIILATLMIILWVLQVLMEIIVEVIEDKFELISDAFNKDVQDMQETIKKPVTVVSNVIKKIQGKEIEQKEEVKNKNIEKLKVIIEKKEKVKS